MTVKPCCQENPCWKGMCRRCYMADWARRWRQRNPEKARESARRFNAKHRDRRREYNRKRYWDKVNSNPGFRASRHRPNAKHPPSREEHEGHFGHPYVQYYRRDGRPYGCRTCRNVGEVRRRKAKRSKPLTHFEQFGHEKEFAVGKNRPKSVCMVCARLRAARVKIRDPETLEFANLLLRDPCCYCGGKMEAVDHVEPVSRGGASTWDNLTAACGKCNRAKNKSSLLAFLARRAA